MIEGIPTFRQTMTEVWRRFKVLFIVYFLFVILLALSVIYRDWVILIVETKWRMGEGFVMSWQSSLFQDLLFFGATGFLGLVLTTKLPHEENFETRVNVLTNGLNVKDNVKVFMRKALEDLMVYNLRSSITVTIEKVHPGSGLVEVHCVHKNVLANMCADKEFEFPIKAYVFPGPCLDKDYGYLQSLIFEGEKVPNRRHPIYEGPIIPLSKQGYAHEGSYIISPNGSLLQTFTYKIYCSVDELEKSPDGVLFFRSQMFTENFSLHLINQSEMEIGYEYKYPNRVHSKRNKLKRREKETSPYLTGRGRIAASGGDNRRAMRNQASLTIVRDKYMYRNDQFEVSFTLKADKSR